MEFIRIGVAGIAGRMGMAVAKAILEREETVLAGGFEAPGHPALDKPLSELIGKEGA